MDWLTSLYPEVRQVLEGAIPDCWPELRPIFDTIFAKPPPLLSVAILPLVSCHAVNGTAREAIPVSAALIATEVSLRIFDDLEDKDRPGQLWELLGEARAWNYASAIHILSFEILSKASFSPQIFRKVNQLFIDAFFYITVGQERDLIGLSNSIEDYWRTIELKTATAYSAACASGAIVGTENPELIQACGTFGHHVGLAIQIFNDMESIWQPDGITDLKQGKITLPLLYGLQSQHPERDELLSLVTDNEIATHAERIKEIYAYFRLSGVDLDPDEITKIVGVKPTQTWKTGDVVVRSRGKPTIRKFSVWKVKSKLAPSEELDPTRELEIHIESVFEQLQPGWQQLAKISYQYEALICCVVYAYSHVPAISFNQQIIHKASELSAGIDLDMYCRLNWKKQEQE